ncbi:hypothetical protein SPRG_01401 [Saprolegnia parasitica CBS 223.65]|uniref:Transcription factor CBF/NF-Y/archaeal histone domain-containing protein n=1 Tax=Saprolegnia parasitica (strain CBS 223.65) TaxID=695850 RepID=A0A067D617_SAPPC|nr:hypothetical protein SPRG_01401 [Saprolegnia parasitica CBS 223.65]KDO34131.1 hypothetical protein SPRG_01401 [Saprolegnia parasitica CBS 223.65]|eukprot:XP_012195008.1 hypothetical protein SPRG_01401 [Saprolegnia parasitica CBS 223.65]
MEHDLPLVSVTRAAKLALPTKAGLTKEGKELLQTAAGIFVLYLTAAADDECKTKGRQTISGNDVFKALQDVDFGQLVAPTADFLQRAKATAKKPKATAAKDDTQEHDDNNGEDDEEETKEMDVGDEEESKQDAA